MLLSMIIDDDEEGTVTALFQVGDVVMQLKQRPDEGRVLDKEKEERQERAMEQPEDPSCQVASAPSQYDSAFPNVGLVVWQAGFVLADYLLRTKPLGPWTGLKVLELGCGTGQLGIALALAGADVTLTDLAHITPLTQVNVDLNAACCQMKPAVTPYMWGTPVEQIQLSAAAATADQQQKIEQGQQQQQQQQLQGVDGEQQQQQQQQREQQQQQHWDVIVAADVLYEPQYYGVLMSSLEQLCPAAGGGSSGSPPIYICYRVRKYRESSFEVAAEAHGFKVTAAPLQELHVDYNCGGWRLICLTRQ